MNGPSDDSVLVLSQDYELFFQESGTVERCLLEPSRELLKFAAKRGIKLTFFVDVGMLRAFSRHSKKSSQFARDLADVRENLKAIADAGHEIGLHVHPHWEDTRWVDGRWDFSNTRYQLRDFSDSEIGEMFRSYFYLLQDITDKPIASYRAGGFCIEPFSRIKALLSELRIDVESSVVPGARLVDADKGFDFSSAPDKSWWFFDESPTSPQAAGTFMEIPITPNTVSRFFYWGRLLERVGPARLSENFGDGVSKAIGPKEILRRLMGGSRTSELSIDDAKAAYLERLAGDGASRKVWHLMGHPKLLSLRSLAALDAFIEKTGIRQYLSVSGLARRVRAGQAA